MRISLATTVLLILLVVQVAESRRPSKAEARINKGLKVGFFYL
jgi:hypothetical protein